MLSSKLVLDNIKNKLKVFLRSMQSKQNYTSNFDKRQKRQTLKMLWIDLIGRGWPGCLQSLEA
jgi:hypothetical protein